MKLNYRANCFSCKQGEQQGISAQWFITGHNGSKPFRGYVCGDHYEMMANDGLVTSAKWIDLDGITSYFTGFNSFNDMVKSVNYCYTPTLRTDKDKDLEIVRIAFNDKMKELGLPNRA
jgi:hypothetical protein